jgi:hypothetical protein
MHSLSLLLQIIIALGILNVWLLRFGKSTAWRGGNAQYMKEEFEVYGLPEWFMRVIGGLRIQCGRRYPLSRCWPWLSSLPRWRSDRQRGKDRDESPAADRGGTCKLFDPRGAGLLDMAWAMSRVCESPWQNACVRAAKHRRTLFPKGAIV